MYKFIVFLTCMAALFGSVVPYPEDDDVAILSEPLDKRNFKMPESCKSKNMEFCFDNTNYPVDIIETLLKNLTNLEVAKEDDVGQIDNRYGTPNDDENECRALSETAPIHYIVDENDRDRVVVQMAGKFEQRYSVMWCDKEGYIPNRTLHFSNSTVNNMKMKCENKYMHYDFLVLSLKPDILGEWNMEKARTKTGIPVCCACRY